jgi:hypothetical protein
MHKHTFALVALLAAPLAHAEDKAPDMNGAYKYTGSFVLTVTSPQKQSATDTEEGTLTVAPSKKGGLVFTMAEKGQTCHLNGTASGSTVKFASGQTCNQADEWGNDLTITLSTGTATYVDGNFTLNLAWKVSGSMGGLSIAGKATETLQAEGQ